MVEQRKNMVGEFRLIFEAKKIINTCKHQFLAKNRNILVIP